MEAAADLGGALVLIAPDADDEAELEAVSDALGIEVVRLDPAEADGDPAELLVGAAAILIEWDLGASTGLDWLEALVGEPRLIGVPVALCSDEPTRVRVVIALKSGASGFFCRPLDPDELAERLVLTPRPDVGPEPRSFEEGDGTQATSNEHEGEMSPTVGGIAETDSADTEDES